MAYVVQSDVHNSRTREGRFWHRRWRIVGCDGLRKEPEGIFGEVARIDVSGVSARVVCNASI